MSESRRTRSDVRSLSNLLVTNPGSPAKMDVKLASVYRVSCHFISSEPNHAKMKSKQQTSLLEQNLVKT